MAIFHQGMIQRGQHEGRADAKAAKGGHEVFGRSGGGVGGIHTQTIASPTQPIALPKEEK